MPQATLRTIEIQADLKRLDELIAAVTHQGGPAADLLIEHLHSARTSLLGAMPNEYAAGLQSAKEISTDVPEKPLRLALTEALDYLLCEISQITPTSGAKWRHHTHERRHNPSPPGTTAKLWSFFDRSDTSFGTFYPKRYIVAIFPSLELTKAAERALQGVDFGADDALAVPGAEILKFFEEMRFRAGLWGELMGRVSRAFGTEASFVEKDIHLAQEGAGFLVIYSPVEAESARIYEIVKAFGSISMQRYSTLGIQSLI